jgi:hypothetical protein
VLVASPLTAYAVVQQLMPQVFGLALAAALLSWLMRAEIHRNPGPRLPDVFAISTLTACLFVVYVELAALLCAGYLLYASLLMARRQISLRAVAVILTAPLAAIAVAVNTFLPRELGYLRAALRFGVETSGGGLALFGYALVPTALPGVVGLQRLFAAPATPHMQVSIVFAAALLVGALLVCLVTARKESAAAIALLADAGVAVLLAKNGNDFGLFKLYMYVQPFLAAAMAIWLSALKNRVALALASVLLVTVVGLQLSTSNAYIDQSRNPIDLRHASEPDLLPNFRRLLSAASGPVVSVTDNFALAQLQAAAAGDAPLYFVSRNVFGLPWKKRAFSIPSPTRRKMTIFGVDLKVARLLSHDSCTLSFPTGSQLPLNRRTFPEGSRDLISLSCSKARNLLVFVTSTLGQPATLPENRRVVSFWQLEGDPSFQNRTFSGFGRYALFQVLGGTPKVRVELSFTTSPAEQPGGSFRLPPATIDGAGQSRLPIVGSGSARVFSPPLLPRIIDGRPYLVLDMGMNVHASVVRRPGLTGVWGKFVPLDPRLLTSYVRDVSLVSPAQYARLSAPRAIRHFPADLGNPNLEYSGIYEDGWVGQKAYAYLAGGAATTLVLSAEVLPAPRRQELRVRVNGETVIARQVQAGRLTIRARVPASPGRRKIVIEWSSLTPLAAPDRRRAAARLTKLGEDAHPRQ